MPEIKVVIVGAGLGGLCPAQTLRKAYIGVEVSNGTRARGNERKGTVCTWKQTR
jgi:phytoene dehydrogenase-like protein